MPDTPDLPEAKDPFERRVAISIAIMAVLLSVISTKGDNAKTDAILKTNDASNQWAFFQAKSVKGHLTNLEAELAVLISQGLSPQAGKPPGTDELIKKLKQNSERYDSEKEEIKGKAEELQKEAGKNSEINDKCDLAALLLQIAVVIASVAILTHWRLMWYGSLALGGAGAVAGITAYF